MSSAYQIKLDQFSGPLEKLLELIEARELEVSKVSMAEVTFDFLNYLKTLKTTADASILADFLVVAAKLVLIKSKSLIPDLTLTEDEEAGINDLEARLAIYREFSYRNGGASARIAERWNAETQSYSRKLFTGYSDTVIFHPGEQFTIENLRSAVENLASVAKELFPEPEKIKGAVVTLEEKIQELAARCREAVTSFKTFSEQKTRSEIVVMFLALLHLLKERIIEVEQSEHFSDIIVRNSPGIEGNSGI